MKLDDLHDVSAALLLRDPTAMAAATRSLEVSGVRVVDDRASAQVWLSDTGTVGPAPTVLLVRDTPVACVAGLAAVMEGGAQGVVTAAEIELLAIIVRAVAGGVLTISPGVVVLADQLPPLRPRELEVLQLVAQGMPLSQVARSLHVSHATVKREMAALFYALGVGSRVELVLAARRLGLLESTSVNARTAPRCTPSPGSDSGSLPGAV